uniref:probable ATP-dependent RNA helicase DDX60 n=1 Tax=Pristiophorus japonicus TaxID=55135 RepID=UPI00398F8CF5
MAEEASGTCDAEFEPLQHSRPANGKHPDPFSTPRDEHSEEEESDSEGEDTGAEIRSRRRSKLLNEARDAARAEMNLDQVAPESSDEELDISQTGAEKSIVSKGVPSDKGDTASVEENENLKYLRWLSQYLTRIFARCQKVSLLRDFVESEFFVIDGDSLMMTYIHEATVDPGQNLHFFYLLECFLFDLTQKKAKFVIIFFKDAECIWKQYCSHLSIRTALILHLQHNTEVPVHTEFDNCFDPRWKKFLDDNHPYFVMVSDKAFPSNKRWHPGTGWFHVLMLHTLGNKINIVLSSGMTQDLLRVYGYHMRSKPINISTLKQHGAEFKSAQQQLVKLAPFYGGMFCAAEEEELMKRKLSGILRSYSQLKRLGPKGSDISRIVCVVSCSAALKVCGYKMAAVETTAERRGTTENKEDEPEELTIQGAADVCRMYCLHVTLLRNLPLSQRALKNNSRWTKPVNQFLMLRQMMEFLVLKNLGAADGWNVDMTYLSDLSDGHLFKSVAKICSEMPSCTESERQLGNEIGGEYRHIWETVAKLAPEVNVGPAFPVTCPSGALLQPADNAEPGNPEQNIPSIGLIPMTSTLAEEYVGDLLEQLPQLGSCSEDPALTSLLKLKKFDEDFNFHSGRPIAEAHYETPMEISTASVKDPKERKRMLRQQQKLLAFVRLYGESLKENAAVTIVTNQTDVAKSPSKQQPSPRKGNSKKSGKKKRAELIIEAQEKKRKEEEERKAKELWSSLQEPIRKQMSQDIDKGIKALDRFLQNCRNECVKVTAELEGIKYCLKAWVQHCRSTAEPSRDMKIAVLLMRKIHSVLNRREDQLSPKTLTEVAHYLRELGFLNLRDSVMKMIDADQKRGLMKDPEFPVGLGAARFQLQYMGPFLFREERNDPDPRVQNFIPDTWQRELLDAVDNNESAVVVAPTSSGKTYASYYCMEKVLRSSDSGIVVYVAPNNALINQVVATVYARFTKSLPGGMVTCGYLTRDYQSNVHNCQVLVTVPRSLEILLLSPHQQDWAKRIKYVIFDEVHCLGGEIGAEVWEHLLAIIRCPFLALSATISNPEELTQWLQSVKTYWERVESSSEEPPSSNTSQKSKRKQQARREEQSFKVRLVSYGERYNDLENFVCDFEDNEYKFIPYHPCAALTVHHIKNYGIPSDLALSPPECLRLYDAMVQVSPGWPRAQELEPEEYQSFKNRVIIRKRDVREYEAELKKELVGWVKAGRKKEVEDVLLWLKPQLEGIFEKDQMENFPLLVETLQKMNGLPALFFTFNIIRVEDFADELLKHLMEKLESKIKPGDEKARLQIESRLQKLAKYLEKEESMTNPTSNQSEQLAEYRTEHDMLRTKYQQLHTLPPDCTFAQTSAADEKFLETIFHRMHRSPNSGHYREMLLRGIGHHHGSMNNKIRQAVEMLFRCGFVKVVSATSTLALGINMPCKTVVFLHDSVHLDSLNYRQMSGRAGRRGMDNLGKVIFFDVPLPKVQRLIKANVPQLKGQFPLTISFVLRLMLLAAKADDKADAKAKALSVLQYSMMTFNQPKKQDIVKFYFLFSLQFLLREGFLNREGQPQGFAGLVMHEHYHEPANFVFIRFLVQGLLHKVCQRVEPHSKTFSEDVMETLVLILANLFGRRYLLPCLAEQKFEQSKVILDDLPDEFAACVHEYNTNALQVFGNFLLSISKQANLEEELQLPLSGTSFMRPQLPEATDFASELSKALSSPTTAVSPFACLSGHTDLELFHCCDVDSIIFRTLGIHINNIPVLRLKCFDRQGRRMPLNAYALDFYKHGSLSTLYLDNGLSRGEAFYLVKDFSLVIAAISTSLTDLCDNENDPVVLAFQQLHRSYSSKLGQEYS